MGKNGGKIQDRLGTLKQNIYPCLNLTKGPPVTPGLEVDHGAGVLLGELDHVLLYKLSHSVAGPVTLQNMVSQTKIFKKWVWNNKHRYGTKGT